MHVPLAGEVLPHLLTSTEWSISSCQSAHRHSQDHSACTSLTRAPQKTGRWALPHAVSSTGPGHDGCSHEHHAHGKPPSTMVMG